MHPAVSRCFAGPGLSTSLSSHSQWGTGLASCSPGGGDVHPTRSCLVTDQEGNLALPSLPLADAGRLAAMASSDGQISPLTSVRSKPPGASFSSPMWAWSHLAHIRPQVQLNLAAGRLEWTADAASDIRMPLQRTNGGRHQFEETRRPQLPMADVLQAYVLDHLTLSEITQVKRVSKGGKFFVDSQYPRLTILRNPNDVREVLSYDSLPPIQKLRLEFLKLRDRPRWQQIGVFAFTLLLSPLVLLWNTPRLILMVKRKIVFPIYIIAKHTTGRASSAAWNSLQRCVFQPMMKHVYRPVKNATIATWKWIWRNIIVAGTRWMHSNVVTPTANTMVHAANLAYAGIVVPLRCAVTSSVSFMNRQILQPAKANVVCFTKSVWKKCIIPLKKALAYAIYQYVIQLFFTPCWRLWCWLFHLLVRRFLVQFVFEKLIWHYLLVVLFGRWFCYWILFRCIIRPVVLFLLWNWKTWGGVTWRYLLVIGHGLFVTIPTTMFWSCVGVVLASTQLVSSHIVVPVSQMVWTHVLLPMSQVINAGVQLVVSIIATVWQAIAVLTTWFREILKL